MIRVLAVDDYEIVRDNIASLIGTQSDMELVAGELTLMTMRNAVTRSQSQQHMFHGTEGI